MQADVLCSIIGSPPAAWQGGSLGLGPVFERQPAAGQGGSHGSAQPVPVPLLRRGMARNPARNKRQTRPAGMPGSRPLWVTSSPTHACIIVLWGSMARGGAHACVVCVACGLRSYRRPTRHLLEHLLGLFEPTAYSCVASCSPARYGLPGGTRRYAEYGDLPKPLVDQSWPHARWEAEPPPPVGVTGHAVQAHVAPFHADGWDHKYVLYSTMAQFPAQA